MGVRTAPRMASRLAVAFLGVMSIAAVAACSPATSDATAPSTTRRPTTTTAPTTTTTLPTTTTTAVRIAAPDGLGRGARGDAVVALEQRLLELHYDPGKPDGVYDGSTVHAVIAFQKTYGLTLTGRATQDVLDAMVTAAPPAPFVPEGGATRVEVDIPRQVLFLYKDGALFRIVDVSSGSGRRYCEKGRCGWAVTPRGSFVVERRVSGWRTSDLGKLYNPLYFKGGYAIHGAPSVPATPASHGCVRIPMYISYWFPQHVANGTPVYVLDGKTPVSPVTTTTSTTSTTSSTSTTSTTSTTEPSTTTTTRGGIFP